MNRHECTIDGVRYAVTREDFYPGMGRRFNLREVHAVGGSPVVAHVYVSEPTEDQAMRSAVRRLLGES